MKLITFEDIKSLNINPLDCLDWVSEMISIKSQTQLPAKISLHPFDGSFCNIMPCIIPDVKRGMIGGVKVVNRYPERIPSLDSKLMLLDMKSGEFLTLMDANWITAMRTGAVCAHSVIHFARKSFKTVSIMGLGNTARASLLVLAEYFSDKVLEVRLLKYKGQEKQFCERFNKYKNIHFSYVDNYKDLITDADVIISCVTYFDGDIAEDSWFKEGVLLVPVHTRGFSNCDLFFDKVFADDYSHVCHFKNFSRFKSFAEVSDVTNKIVNGRENDNERILAYNIGLSIHDINMAGKIYEIMNDSGALDNTLSIDMKAPEEKFWF